MWEVSKLCFLCLCLKQKCWKEWDKHNRPMLKVSFQIWEYFSTDSSCTLSIPLKLRSPPSSWLESQDWSMFMNGSLFLSASCTWWPFSAIAPSSLWSGQNPHSMHPCTISFPCWLSLTWACPSHPSPLCWASLFSIIPEFPQTLALLKNSLSTDSQIWSPLCSWSCLLTAFWPYAALWDTTLFSPMPELLRCAWCFPLKACS